MIFGRPGDGDYGDDDGDGDDGDGDDDERYDDDDGNISINDFIFVKCQPCPRHISIARFSSHGDCPHTTHLLPSVAPGEFDVATMSHD